MIFVYTTIYEPVSSQIAIFLIKIVEKALFEALGPYFNSEKVCVRREVGRRGL